MKKQPLKIVKIGGQYLADEEKLSIFLRDFAALQGPRILVHGGGNLATQLAADLGMETTMIHGRRITDKGMLKVIVMTYGGWINKSLVASLQAFGCNAIGLCGADGNSIKSKRREAGSIDFGYVGDIETVNTGFISTILQHGMIPVFSAISYTESGELLNTNGDSIASRIASAMCESYETELLYLFGKKGVLMDLLDDTSVIPKINKETYQYLLKNNKIDEGMLPKLQNSFEALDQGVEKVILGDGEILRKGSLQTEIVK